MNFEITTPAGQSLFRFHVDAHGHLSLTTRGGWDWTSGADRETAHPQRVQGGHSLEVEGEQTIRVAAATRHTYQAAHTTTVADTATLIVGQDHVTRVNRDVDVNAGGAVALTATGNLSRVAVQGDVLDAARTGNYVATAAVDWRVNVTTGNADITPTAGAFRVRTNNLDKIELGTDPTMHGTLYEALEARLNAFAADFNALVDVVRLHVHDAAGTPTTPSTGLQGLQHHTPDWSSARARVVKMK